MDEWRTDESQNRMKLIRTNDEIETETNERANEQMKEKWMNEWTN